MLRPSSMLRVTACFLLICLCANAQFFGLATPADGSRVYFATTLRQQKTNQPTYGKLFQVDSSGLHLVLSRDEVIFPPPVPAQSVQTNPYDLFAASVSADGKVVAAAARRGCPYGSCTYFRLEAFTTTVTAAGQDKDYPGNLQLSANGEWAFGRASEYYGPQAYLVHVTTGEQVALNLTSLDHLFGVLVAATGRAVADDGTVVYAAGPDIVTIHAGQIRRISIGYPYPGAPVCDRTGATIVFSVNNTIRLADPSGPSSSLLLSDAYAPSLSDDGRTLLYFSNRTGTPQMRIFRFNGFTDDQLADDPAGIAQAILSGDGSTVYAVTLGARLLKISVATCAVQELIPRTPYLSSITNGSFPAPGKLTRLPGVGLTDVTVTAGPPLPDSLNGFSVTMQGRTAKIQGVAPNAITVLVPPDIVPSDNGTVTVPVDVTLTSPSPFDSPHADLWVPRYAPEFLLTPGPNVVAAHQDWSALVSAGNPARPGEVIHAYAVGLGDTSPAVPYGQPAPAREPLARVTIPIDCGQAELLFQGLAPNLAGLYQIDVRVPPSVPDGDYGLVCVWGGIGTGGPYLSGRIPVARPLMAAAPALMPAR